MSYSSPGTSSSSPLPPSGQPREPLPSHSDEDFISSDDVASLPAQSDHLDEAGAIDLNNEDPHSTSPFSPRPNRYHGPPSTWRTWTAEDRAIANSLDDLRARDLSIHLYNAHGLKRRARDLKRKRLETDDSDEDEIWKPPRIWTAWPMEAEIVPRGYERHRLDGENDRPVWCSLQGSQGSREELQEILIAITLKNAREKFLARDLENQTSSPETSPLAEHSSDATNHSPAQSQNSLSSTSTSSSSSSTQSSSSLSRGPSSPSRPSNPQSPTPSLSPQQTKPHRSNLMPLADDTLATQILTPTTSHLLSKLNHLLTSLHHARQTLLFLPNGTGSNASSRACSVSSSRHSRSRLRTQRAQQTSSSPSATPSASPSPPQKRRRSSSRRQASPGARARVIRSRQPRLGLRDWSEVLGIATLIGWEANVIERARKRCEALFDERMEFLDVDADISKGSGGDGETGESEDEVSQDTVEGSGMDRKERDKRRRNKEKREKASRERAEREEMMGGVHVDGFLKPIQARKGWRGPNKGPRKRKGEGKGKEIERGNEREEERRREIEAEEEEESEVEAEEQDVEGESEEEVDEELC